MADKSIQIKARNGATWDSLYPRTKADIVLMADGVKSVSTKLTEVDTAINTKASMTDVNNAINTLVASAPLALDTLKELADALGNDANFATTVTNNLATKAPLASPTFTGSPVAPTQVADDTTTKLATTAFVVGQASTVAPLVDGVATIGTSKKFARADHKHPSDTTKANLATPSFTGTPTAPTALQSVNNTQLATTAYVRTAIDSATLGSPTISPTEPSTGDLWYQEI